MNLNKKEEKEIPILGNNSFNKKTVKFSVNSLGKSSGNLLERLKNLSKKDIAFVIAGLGILIMAPIAEFFLSKPQADNLLAPGFGERKASESGGLNLYDSGVNALSSGSPDGSGEVITPLTARDPSSLIIGAQQTPPPPPPPQTTFRDSMKDVAEKSFSQAVKSSPAPFIPPKMNASLRGFSSFFGGGESSRSSGSLGGGANVLATAQKASTKTEKRSMVGPVAIPGYKGVASNTPNSASKGALEQLRNQAGKAADFFSGDNAIRSLDQAAKESVMADKGEGGGSALFDGAKGDKPSNSSLRGSNSYSPGDPCSGSLENKLNCERAKKAFEYEMWKKYEIPKQIMQAMIDGFLKKGLIDPLSEWMAGTVKELVDPSPAPDPLMCIPAKLDANGQVVPANPSLPASQNSNCIPDFSRAASVAQEKGKDVSTYKTDYCCLVMKKSQMPKGSGSPTTPTSVDNSIQANLQTYDQNLIELKKIHDKYYKQGASSIIIPEADAQKTKQLVNSTAQLGGKLTKDIATKGNANFTNSVGSLDTSKPNSSQIAQEFTKAQQRIALALFCLENPNSEKCKPILTTGVPKGASKETESPSVNVDDKTKLKNAEKGIIKLGAAFSEVMSACIGFTDNNKAYFYDRNKNKYLNVNNTITGNYSNIEGIASGQEPQPNNFFPTYLSLEEGANPSTPQSNPPGKITTDFDNMAYIPVKGEMRSAPISPHLISVVLSKTTFAQTQVTAQPVTKSAFLQLVNYRGIKLDKFKTESKIEEKVYGLTKDSKLPGAAIKNKIDNYIKENSDKWVPVEIVGKLKDCVNSGASCDSLGVNNPYTDEGFSMKLQETTQGSSAPSSDEPVDIKAVDSALQFINNDITVLSSANSQFKTMIEDFLSRLKKPTEYYPLTPTNGWIIEILSGKWDSQIGGSGPGTTSPGTTSPGTTSPGTTAPSTTSPSNTGPGSPNIDAQKDKFIKDAQGFLNDNPYDPNRYTNLGKKCDKPNNPCGTKWKEPWKIAGEQLKKLQSKNGPQAKVNNIIAKAKDCKDQACLDALQKDLDTAKAEYKKLRDGYNDNMLKAETLANGYVPPAPTNPTNPTLVNSGPTISYFDGKLLTAREQLKEIESCKNKDICKGYYQKAEGAVKEMHNIKVAFMKACGEKCKQSVINKYRADFDKQLGIFNTNYSLAKKALQEEKKQFCYNTKSGCDTVTSFYVVQRWKVIKQGKHLGFIYSAPSGAEGQAWDRVYDKYKNQLLSTQQRQNACKEVWDSTWLTIRQYINFSGKSTGIENCNKIWFEPVYEVKYSQSGKVSSGNDVVRIVAKRESGNNTAKSYRGSGQNLFNSEIEVLCSPRNGIWKTDSLSIRIDKPVSYTSSESFSMNLGVSGGGLSGGVGYSQSYGVSTSVPYGTWRKISVENLNCGSNMDNISNE